MNGWGEGLNGPWAILMFLALAGALSVIVGILVGIYWIVSLAWRWLF